MDSAHRLISVHRVDDGRRVHVEEGLSHALDYHRTMSQTNLLGHRGAFIRDRPWMDSLTAFHSFLQSSRR